MGAVLLGLVLGLAIGFALGRRSAATRPAVASPATTRPAAPSPTRSTAGQPAPLATPNKRGRKVGLTEADFLPADDILERMRQAWTDPNARRSGGDVRAPAGDVGVPPAQPAPSGGATIDPDLEVRTQRVLERLERTGAEKETDTMAATPEDPAPEASPSAGTVTEALTQLDAEGYGGDLRFHHGEVACRRCGAVHGTQDVEVDRVLRFEGPSDPADEAIVLGLRCPVCGAKGSLVSAFGPDADPELADAFVYWSAHAKHG